MANLTQKGKETINTIKKYWTEPPAGNYVPYKEIAALSGGGIGVHWATTLASYIGLDAGNFLIGSTLQIDSVHLGYMLIIANLIGMPFAFLRGWLFDNHNMKGGKFIPFLLRTPLPIVLLSTVFVWLPFENVSYITKVILTEIFFIVIQNLVSFYSDSFAYIQQIITPNAQERVKVLSVSQIIYSIAPTITGLVIPTVAGLTFGMNNIWTYRIIYPAFTFVGLILSCVFFRKVKERLVLPKTRRQHVRIFDALREIAKNKYYWIINIAVWIGFLEGAYGAILGWTFVYSDNGNKAVFYGTATTIISNAALWSMILAPFAIKYFGKRNLLILCNVLNIIIFSVMYFTFRNVIVLCALLFINGFINTFGNIYFPAINADMRDYHQWKTGVRVDGMFTPMGLIGTVIGFGTSLVVPYIYRYHGLETNYDILYDDAMRNSLFESLIIATIIGAFVNLIPYLFYDLTETKHKGYVSVLKIRAMFEDYGCGDIAENQLSEAVNIIRTAREHYGKTPLTEDKSLIKKAKKLSKKTPEEKAIRAEEIRKAKAEFENIKEYNENIQIAPIIIEELNKFSSERFIRQTERAKITVSLPKVHIYEDAAENLRLAKNMNKGTKEEKELRLDAIKDYRLQISANKFIKKYGIENIFEPDERIREELETRETSSFSEHLKTSMELRRFAKQASVYARITEPHNKAVALLRQKEDFERLDEIEKLTD